MSALVVGAVRDQRGQMCVELAVLMPVTVVIALIVLNLARYVELCTRFDRVALDAVVACGVSPSGSTSEGAAGQVQTRIAQAFDGVERLEVTVSCEPVGRLGGGGTTFSLVPSLSRYVCEMRMAPWPSSFSIAGVSMGPPAFLVHRRSLVVDGFRSGVVV